MGAIPNQKWERFARCIASDTMSKFDAYVQACDGILISKRTGKQVADRDIYSMAHKASLRSDVVARVQELREEQGKRVEKAQGVVTQQLAINIATLIKEADKIQSKAVESKQYSAAIAALVAKAKLAGLWIEKSETTNAHYAISDEPMSRDEWKSEFVTGTQH